MLDWIPVASSMPAPQVPPEASSLAGAGSRSGQPRFRQRDVSSTPALCLWQFEVPHDLFTCPSITRDPRTRCSETQIPEGVIKAAGAILLWPVASRQAAAY